MTEYLTVSTLTKYLKRKFDADPYLETVYLQGEVSNFRLGKYFNQYFNLKDESASINAQIPTRMLQSLNFTFENQLKVLCVGHMGYTANRNQPFFMVDKIVPDGIGELALKLEELKKRLTAEGLFAPELKKPLPQFNHRIGVITASSGAVIHDIIRTVNIRFPMTDVVLFASKVSGAGSVEQLVARLQEVNAREDIDVIIIGRGGGSLEDLWSFNEEAVVRAIVASQIPVISSVGHETDTTLADFAADARASTPTQAAEFATPNTKADLLGWLAEAESRQRQALSNLTGRLRKQLAALTERAVFKQPDRLYDGLARRVDEATRRLSDLTGRLLDANRHRFERLDLLGQFDKLVQGRKSQFDTAYQKLLMLDTSKIQARGFAIVTDSGGKIVKSSKSLKKGDQVALKFADGERKADIAN
ncbi:MAG: exodeoxyribonuclease VII large subunit [Streptococcaceae bacterium]|jgi:exodeoxyribonuclease VII large subunit|nr:exodeoxyribonuclease VII large subunit [Streptococcaceae bacterium]